MKIQREVRGDIGVQTRCSEPMPALLVTSGQVAPKRCALTARERVGGTGSEPFGRASAMTEAAEG